MKFLIVEKLTKEHKLPNLFENTYVRIVKKCESNFLNYNSRRSIKAMVILVIDLDHNLRSPFLLIHPNRENFSQAKV